MYSNKKVRALNTSHHPQACVMTLYRAQQQARSFSALDQFTCRAAACMVVRARRAAGLARRSEGADPVNSNSQANAGRFDYNMYNLGLNFI
jgi:hypothetical protein